MLTIKNILKLQNQPIWDGWDVTLIYEGNQNDTYVFELARHRQSITERCTIMLERNGIVQRTSTHPIETAYFFIFDSQRTDVCVTADWIADKDNMVGQLKYLLEENGKASYV